MTERESARARRERYVGDWLPEPIITDGDDDPARRAETVDSLSLAMLVVLQTSRPSSAPYCCCTTCSTTGIARSRRSSARARTTCVSSPPAPELTGDGGGKVPALARSLRGRSRVARAIVSWVGRVARLPGVSLRLAEINGGPGALLLDGQQRLIGVCALDTSGAQITSISGIVNLDKLMHLGPVGDFRSLLRSAK